MVDDTARPEMNSARNADRRNGLRQMMAAVEVPRAAGLSQLGSYGHRVPILVGMWIARSPRVRNITQLRTGMTQPPPSPDRY
jgi:hypothetical protein